MQVLLHEVAVRSGRAAEEVHRHQHLIGRHDGGAGDHAVRYLETFARFDIWDYGTGCCHLARWDPKEIEVVV